MKGELTGLFLWSSPHAMIRALVLEVLFRGGGGEGERGGRWRRDRWRDRGEVKARQAQEGIARMDRVGWEKWVGW